MQPCTRREFTQVVLACAGTAAIAQTWPGCGSPFDGTVALSGGQVVLTFSDFPALGTIGGSAIVQVQESFPIAVVRTTGTKAVALSATCTHVGCILRYASDSNDLHCDCHNANFDLSGAVLSGPTNIPLPTYAAVVGAEAISVTIG